MAAGDADRPEGGWVPTEPPPDLERPDEPSGELAVEPPLDAPTQPVTRASLRRAREETVRRHAQGWVAADTPGRTVLGLTTAAAVLLAVLVGLSALVGTNATVLAVGFTTLVLTWAWASLTGSPSPRVGTVVLTAGGLAVCVTAGLTRTEPYLVWVPVTVAVSLIAAFLHQVLRKGGRPRLTAGVAAAVGALATVTSGVALVPLPRYGHGGSWVLMAMVAVAAASVPLPWAVGRLSGLAGLLPVLVLGVAGAVAVALQQGGIPLVGALLTGVVTAAVAHSTQRVLLGLPGSRGAQGALGAGAASVLVVGVLAYLLTRLYAG